MRQTNIPLESRKLLWPGHLFFVGYALLATFLFRERALVVDGAFHVFQIIQTGNFAIFHNRFSPFLAQLPSVLAVNFRAPLNVVLVLYSVSVPLFCYACFVLAIKWLKDYRAAVGIVLVAGIMLTDAFYFPTAEINQAVCVLILIFSLLQQRLLTEKINWLILTIGVVFALFFHPLIIIGFVYLAGYYFLQDPKRNLKTFLLVLGLGVAVFLMKALFFTSAYESDKLSLPAMIKLLPSLYKQDIVRNFGRWLVQDYYWFLIISALVIWHYFKRQQWWLLSWFVITTAGFLLLEMLAYPQGNDSLRYYLELHYQLFALFAVLPFCFDVLPTFLPNYRFVVIVLFVLVFNRLLTFYTSRTIFEARLQWYEKLYTYTDRYPEKRFVVDVHNLKDLVDQNCLTWASAHETLLYFASTHKQPLKTIFLSENPSQFNWVGKETNKVITAFSVLSDADLPEMYFKLPASRYRYLNTSPATGIINQKNNLKIEPVIKTINAKAGHILRIPVKIYSKNLLASGLEVPETVQLSYRLYQNDQEKSAFTIKTPLEVDVDGSYTQMLLVEAPVEKGTYLIVPGFFPHNISVWQNTNGIKLHVE